MFHGCGLFGFFPNLLLIKIRNCLTSVLSFQASKLWNPIIRKWERTITEKLGWTTWETHYGTFQQSILNHWLQVCYFRIAGSICNLCYLKYSKENFIKHKKLAVCIGKSICSIWKRKKINTVIEQDGMGTIRKAVCSSHWRRSITGPVLLVTANRQDTFQYLPDHPDIWQAQISKRFCQWKFLPCTLKIWKTMQNFIVNRKICQYFKMYFKT